MGTPTFTRELTTVTYFVKIEGAEPAGLGSRSATLFRPITAKVTFTSSYKAPTVIVTGVNIKKDGSDGNVYRERSMWNPEERPDWYDALTESLRPAADLALGDPA